MEWHAPQNLMRAFDLKAEAIVHLADDTVPSPDALMKPKGSPKSANERPRFRRRRSTITSDWKPISAVGSTSDGGKPNEREPSRAEKYPHLCALGDQLQAICGKSLKVIHCVRPIEESIESLKQRSVAAKRTHPGLVISDQQAEAVQRWLWEEKERFLRSVDHLDIDYTRLLQNPADVVYEMIEYLGISPSDDQINKAIQHIDAKLRHVNSAR